MTSSTLQYGSMIASGYPFPNGKYGDLFYLTKDLEYATSGLYVFLTDWKQYSLDKDLFSFSKLHGHEDNKKSVLTYSSTSRTVLMTPMYTEGYAVWSEGKRTVIKEVVTWAHPNKTGEYFCCFDKNLQPTVLDAPWDLHEVIPCCYVYYNKYNKTGYALEERHGAWRNIDTHINLHYTLGTQVLPEDFIISDYTIGEIQNNEYLRYSIAAGSVIDEDIIVPCPKSTRPYTIFYREAVSDGWTWTKNNVPYLCSESHMYYNKDYGGHWSLAQIHCRHFINYYVCVAPILDKSMSVFSIVGQEVHSSLETARNERIVDLDLYSLPLSEVAPLYKITYTCDRVKNASYGRASIVEITRLTGNKQAMFMANRSENRIV